MKSGFQTKTFGKWILCGEHAVLRGYPALAFPLNQRYLELSHAGDRGPFRVEFSGTHGQDYKLLFYGVIENAVQKLAIKDPILGQFILHSELPVGTGLGASAALCGAVARWCDYQGFLSGQDLYEFARSLEDLFHGESSGVDLAVSLSGQGIRFVRGGIKTPIRPTWWPKLYLSYSGQRGVTSECVTRVKAFLQDQPDFAKKIDEQMARSVELALQSLESENKTDEQSYLQLAEALDLANSCFEIWGLANGNLEKHLSLLRAHGAQAVKPTGSGGGGFALSLWKDDPPVELASMLIPLTQPLP